MAFIDLIVSRLLIARLSLYTRLKPTFDKKIGIMGLTYIIINKHLTAEPDVQGSNPGVALIFKFLFIFNS